MKCSKCGAELTPGALFCRECGTKVVREQKTCKKCGKELPEGTKFCTFCGTKIDEQIQSPEPAANIQTDNNTETDDINTWVEHFIASVKSKWAAMDLFMKVISITSLVSIILIIVSLIKNQAFSLFFAFMQIIGLIVCILTHKEKIVFPKKSLKYYLLAGVIAFAILNIYSFTWFSNTENNGSASSGTSEKAAQITGENSTFGKDNSSEEQESSKQPSKIKMINVIGLTVAEGTEKLQKAGFTNISSDAEADDWLIVKQDKAAGFSYAEDIEIVLTCHENNKIPMVDVIDKSLEEAKAILSEAGFLNISSSPKFEVTDSELSVSNQNIKAGELVFPEEAIILTCINKAEMVSMINVVGKSLDEAKQLLTEAGFTNIKTKTNIETDETKWVVSEQSVDEGAWKLPDDPITLTCVKNPDYIITMINVVGKSLDEAKQLLSEAGFTNVSATTDSNTSDASWVVTEQSIKVGVKTFPEELIELTCTRQSRLYLDIASEMNLMFSTYDIEIELDGQKIGTVSNGEYFSVLYDEIALGKHELVFLNAENNEIKASKTFTVEGDTTFSCELAHNSTSIQIKNAKTADNVDGASLEIPDVVGMVLSDAKSILTKAGFSNVHGEAASSIWVDDNWYVTAQNVSAGEKIDKNTYIQLDCIKLSEYFQNTYVNLTVAQIEPLAKEKGFTIRYENPDGEDITSNVSTMSDDVKGQWKATKARQYGGADKTAVVTITSPMYEAEKAAEAAAKAAAESSRKAESSNSSSGSNSSSQKEENVSYSNQPMSKAKNGNSGVFAYKNKGQEYDVYYIVDFEEGYVYRFTYGNSDTTGDKVRIVSGDLNSSLVITYNDGSSIWSNTLHFKYKNQPSHMILDDEDGFSTDFDGTDLDDALRIKRTKTFTDYSMDSEDESTWVQLFILMIDDSLESAFKGNYKVYYEDGIIHIDAWIDGTAACATLAKEGDENALAAWKSVKGSVESFSQTLEGNKDVFGISSVPIQVSILNDLNLDKGVLIYYDGECIYDYVTD